MCKNVTFVFRKKRKKNIHVHGMLRTDILKSLNSSPDLISNILFFVKVAVFFLGLKLNNQMNFH